MAQNKNAQPESSPPAAYGVARAQQVMTSEGRWPRLRPKDGERARFHFLTSGNDPWFCGSKFHRIKDGEFWNEIVCLRVLTQGIEACGLCAIDQSNLANRFACWVWVDYILHPMDNPDEGGDPWEQKQLKLSDGKTRTVFMEKVDGRAMLLRLPAGQGQAWFAQFTNAWMVSGDLRKHLYELHRTGSGRDDTDYTLSSVKEDALGEDILGQEEIKNLPAIEDIFRESLSTAASAGAGLMGTDSLAGGEPETLPSIAPSSVETDDLI